MLVGMVNDYKMKMDRNACNVGVYDKWLHFLYTGGKVETYFQGHGYGKIMIYGNGYIGKRLLEALLQTNVKVAAVMDKNTSGGSGLVIGTGDNIPEVDCIVITPVFFYDEIYSMLREKTDIPIVSINDVIGADS